MTKKAADNRKPPNVVAEISIDGLYWDLYGKYKDLLGDDPYSLMCSVLTKEQQKFPIFSVVNAHTEDIKKANRVANHYAKTGKIQRLSKCLQWHMGVRFMLASGMLYPYRKRELPQNGLLSKLLNKSSVSDLARVLLVDFVPVYCSVLSDFYNLESELGLHRQQT